MAKSIEDISFEVKRIIMHKLQFGASERIPRHVIDSIGVEAAANTFAGHLELHLHAFVTSSRTKNVHVIRTEKIPLTWVDAFRIEYFPKWFTKKYPIRYRKITTVMRSENTYIFPDMPFPKDPGISDFYVEYAKGGLLDTRRAY